MALSYHQPQQGVRYEMATSVLTGEIVWIHGPFPCGTFPDLRIFRLGLKRFLDWGERVSADRGYRGDRTIITPFNPRSDEHQEEMGRARARHEVLNGKVRRFDALEDCWRHDTNKHYFVYASACVITNIEIRNGVFDPFVCTADHDNLDL